MVKLNKIYTRTGDDGTTGLVGGERIRKDSARVSAYGTVDEANSALGLARLHATGEALAILGRDFRAGPHDELGLHRTATCRMTEEASIPLMIDGERCDGGLREQFSLAELSVDLFCSGDG